MKSGKVVYINSDPTNVVGLFFDQSFPAGKTAAEAATAFQATLIDATPAVIPSEQRDITLDDYNLLTATDVNL